MEQRRGAWEMKDALICCLANVTPIIQVGDANTKTARRHMAVLSVHVHARGVRQ